LPSWWLRDVYATAPVEPGFSLNPFNEQMKFPSIFTGLPSPDCVLCKLYGEHLNRRLLVGIWGFEGISRPKNKVYTILDFRF
jgi:hypothetical protein